MNQREADNAPELPLTSDPDGAPDEQFPETDVELAAALGEASEQGLIVLPRGAGTRAHLGALPGPVDRVVATTKLDQIVFYEPGDLTITVQAGVGLADLDDRLAEHDQWLPHQPYRRSGTVGGLLATGADGLLEGQAGRIRDAVVGARFALADGTLAKARGRVVKNVAGFDIPRLLVGSFGTLAIITEVSLRLAPRPSRQLTLVFGASTRAGALALARRLGAPPIEPAFVAVLCGACTPQVVIGLDGSGPRVDGQRRQVLERAAGGDTTGELQLEDDDSIALRRRLDDPLLSVAPPQLGDPPAGPTAVLRWSGLPTAIDGLLDVALPTAQDPQLALRADVRPQRGLVYLIATAQNHEALARYIEHATGSGRASGATILLSAPDRYRRDAESVWGPAPPDLPLMRRVKQALDPGGTLAPGRFVGGL